MTIVPGTIYNTLGDIPRLVISVQDGMVTNVAQDISDAEPWTTTIEKFQSLITPDRYEDSLD